MEAQSGRGPSPHAALKAARSHALQTAAQAWVAELLGVAEPRELADPLLLGRVAEALHASLRGQRGEIAARVPPLQPSARGRITGYARWQQLCRDLGVGADQVPALADVEEGHGGPAVCACVWAVAERAAALGLPVPRFGGADWRAGMPREVAVKRAELFEGSGQSPPKLPALNKLLTPRAYACKPDSPAGGGGIPALRDSNSSLRDWLHGGGSGQKGAGSPGGWEEQQEQEQEQEQEQMARGLGSTVAALEAAAAEAAEAARQLKQQQEKAQAMRRPSLPPLDVAAAAAAAAAEQDSGGRGTYAASPLSSPGSSYGSPGGVGYCSSSAYLSSASSPALPSPARYRLTPTRLQQSSVANPLFDQPAASPQCSGASQAGGAPAAALPPHPEAADDAAAGATERGTCGSSRSSATAGARPLTGLLQRSPVRHLEREKEEDEEGEAAYLRGSFGGGSDLLESLLSPPHMKPVHTQLLGALMHTRTAASAHGSKPAQQAEPRGEQGGEEGGEEEPAAPAGVTAEGLGAPPVKPPALEEPSPAEQPAEPVATVQPAAAGPATAAQGRGGGSLRRFTLLLLGAAAGAAAAVLAQQQGGGSRSRAGGQPPRKGRSAQQSGSSSQSEDQHLELTRG